MQRVCECTPGQFSAYSCHLRYAWIYQVSIFDFGECECAKGVNVNDSRLLCITIGRRRTMSLVLCFVSIAPLAKTLFAAGGSLHLFDFFFVRLFKTTDIIYSTHTQRETRRTRAVVTMTQDKGFVTFSMSLGNSGHTKCAQIITESPRVRERERKNWEEEKM